MTDSDQAMLPPRQSLTTTLPVPKHPLEILIPFPAQPTNPITRQILLDICNKYIDSTEIFSVTFSPLLCPENRNHLFTLKPYLWEVKPGCWGESDL